MAAAILDLDLASLPPEAPDLGPYLEAFVLVRYRGRPVGTVRLPASIVRAGGERFRRMLEDAGGDALDLARLEERLGYDPRGSLDAPAPAATVVVCTRERPEDLRRALASIRAMPADETEVIVVDSGPVTERTSEAVAGFPGVRYLREPRPGLDPARNRALREATHPIVAFCDDDAVVDRLWLRALARNFRDRRTRAVTGLTLPARLRTEAEEWRERHSPFGRGFERRVMEAVDRSPGAAGYVGAGVNMALRKDVVDQVGPFDEALDAGTRAKSGGDTEMFWRILGAGYRLVYDPAALSWHAHAPDWGGLLDTARGYGAGVYAAWTKSLVVQKELSVFHHATAWLLKHQLPALGASLAGRRGSAPPELLLAELRGCFEGPAAYFADGRIGSSASGWSGTGRRSSFSRAPRRGTSCGRR